MKTKITYTKTLCVVALLTILLMQNVQAQNLTANNLTMKNGTNEWLLTAANNGNVFYIVPKVGGNLLWNVCPYVITNGDFIAQKRIGIGTTNLSGYHLAVNGIIRAKEIRVNTNWSDFVFAENYALPSLAQVEAHIQQHKHLPDIPSAAEVEAEGVELGKISSKLLQKIEELTLYVIEQEKRIKALEAEKAVMQEQSIKE